MKKTNISINLVIIIIFLLTSFSQATTKQDKTANESNYDFDNLRSICTNAQKLTNENKYQQLIKQISKDNINPNEKNNPFFSTASKIFDTSLDNNSLDWPMKCHDTFHTGRSPYSTENNSYAKLWDYYSDTWMDTDPAIGHDGIIYVGGGYQGIAGYLFAIYPNGTLKWRYKAAYLILGCCPAIDSNGTIYIGAWDHYLHAVYPNGTLKWKFDTGADIYSSPAIAKDGTIYIGTMAPRNQIIAVLPNGRPYWYYHTGDVITSDPAIGDDGTIYFGSSDHYFYALYPNGTLRWKYQTGDGIQGPPSIGNDGTVLIGSYDGYLYALYPNGTLKWKTPLSYGTATNPSLGNNGLIYIASYSTMHAIYANNGTEKWVIDLGGHVGGSSPAISADGTIYVGVDIGDGSGGDIVAINSDGMQRWRKRIGSSWAESSPAIARDGTIYVCSSSFTGADDWGGLHAFGNGPLRAEANGPYNGYASHDTQFTGDAFGGIPDYSYRWDFGDGNYSDQQNPTHRYMQLGTYNVTFIVIDSDGNSSNDSTTVIVIYAPPFVTITKPDYYIYFFDREIVPFTWPTIVGPITVVANGVEEPLGINHVEFYIDGRLKATVKEAPYTWKWRMPAFLRHHTITVVAYDNLNNTASDDIIVTKFL